jgi:hypothetical protein
MPLSSVLVLIGIIAVFGLFGITLAWADWRTRNLVRTEPTPRSQPSEDMPFKKAA